MEPRSRQRVLMLVAVAAGVLLMLVAWAVWGDTDRERPEAGPAARSPVPVDEPRLYIAFGDSIATGAPGLAGYVERFHRALTHDTGAEHHLINFARDGQTTAGLRTQVRSAGDIRALLPTADVVTWNIVGNDLLEARGLYKSGRCGGDDDQDCLRETVDAFLRDWEVIVDELVSLRDPEDAILRTMTVYNPFAGPDTVDGSLEVFLPYLTQVNGHIADTAIARRIPVADVYRAFNGDDGRTDPVRRGLIHPDGIHPSEDGHRLIADLLRELGYAPLD